MSCGNCFNESLKKIDIFGKMYSFEKKGSQHFKTAIGGLFGIALVIAVAVIGFLFGKEIYERKIPNSNFADELLDYSRISINEVPIMMYFKLEGGKYVEDIQSAFDFKIKMMTFHSNLSITFDWYPGIVPCSSKNFTNHADFVERDLKYAESQGIEAWCINTSPDLVFQNDYNSPNSTFVNLVMSYCDPSKRKCHPMLERIKQGLFITIKTMNSFVDPENYTDPINYYTQSITEQISDAIGKRIFMRYTKNTVQTDAGWILESNVYSDFIQLRSVKQEVNKYKEENRETYWITLESPVLRLKVVRNYLKVQELFAKIGGLFNACIIFVHIIISDYLNFKYYMHILSDFIDGEKTEKKTFQIANAADNVQVSVPLKITNISKMSHNDKNHVKEIDKSLGIKDMTSQPSSKKPYKQILDSLPLKNETLHNKSKIPFEVKLFTENESYNSYFNYLVIRVLCCGKNRKEKLRVYDECCLIVKSMVCLDTYINNNHVK